MMRTILRSAEYAKSIASKPSSFKMVEIFIISFTGRRNKEDNQLFDPRMLELTKAVTFFVLGLLFFLISNMTFSLIVIITLIMLRPSSRPT